MKAQDLKCLINNGLSYLKLTQDEWEALRETRFEGRRFSLHFGHEEVENVRGDGLILISIPDKRKGLRVGLVNSVMATSTFDSRVLVDFVAPIKPGSLLELIRAVEVTTSRTPFDKLIKLGTGLHKVSKKAGETLIKMIAADPANQAALAPIIGRLRKPTHFEDARALQQDAIKQAIAWFRGAGEAKSISSSRSTTTLSSVRLHEDAVIEHDARWMPGWNLVDSDLTGKATFEKDGSRLAVYTANKRSLEKLLGIDLIYLNEKRGSLIMVQYKMMERRGKIASSDDDQDWIVPIDEQFKKELSRMRRFDKNNTSKGSYRLHSGAFYFKLVKRYASVKTGGFILSLGHLDHLHSSGGLSGPKGGMRISFNGLDGQHLRGEAFTDLIASGYVGTQNLTTAQFATLIKESLENGYGVVAAIEAELEDPLSAW